VVESARGLPSCSETETAAASGSALPLAGAFLSTAALLQRTTIILTLVSLLITGGLAARTGGAPVFRDALRLVFWGSLAMLATSLVGRLFNAPV
jgi:VIT1/CCC1 family predicted Fe2+/Mn2+ transporter